MIASGIDEARLKGLLKEALLEALEERREWFSAVVAEAMEDLGMVQAIKEGENDPLVSRDEVFRLLEP